ncbi:hypothetical protein ACHHV8_29045 [Paenibacillus sp. TAB 01]|uniref:hypothetical protein n=1 Tax=Paenibacillus sp. TAB 01 TaxID=3368988 RepID=UPI003750ACB8
MRAEEPEKQRRSKRQKRGHWRELVAERRPRRRSELGLREQGAKRAEEPEKQR